MTSIATERFFASGELELCYQQDGARCDPAVLLIHGIGCQLVQWPDVLIDGLVGGGFRVLRMDHRDVGRSAKLDALGVPDLAALASAPPAGASGSAPPYRLHDMAADAVALLNYLGLASAHVVGISMGGMIGQRIAIGFPQRLRSLCSIMSSSSAAGLPTPHAEIVAALSGAQLGSAAEAVIEGARRSWNLLGGPHFRSTDVGIGRSVEAAFARGHHPAGFIRMMAAIANDRDRADALAQIRTPTLVLHGDADPLVPLACAEDLVRRIAGARLEVLPNMGHDLPEPLIPQLTAALLTHLRASEAATNPHKANSHSPIAQNPISQNL